MFCWNKHDFPCTLPKCRTLFHEWIFKSMLLLFWLKKMSEKHMQWFSKCIPSPNQQDTFFLSLPIKCIKEFSWKPYHLIVLPVPYQVSCNGWPKHCLTTAKHIVSIVFVFRALQQVKILVMAICVYLWNSVVLFCRDAKH